MADVRYAGQRQFIVTLEVTEIDTVRLHGNRENMNTVAALSDLIDFALTHKACEICQEEKDVTPVPDSGMGLVDINLVWPTHGPYAIFNDDDKRFVASVLAMSLREALTVVLYKRGFEGKHNVVERGNEEDGSGESAFPVN